MAHKNAAIYRKNRYEKRKNAGLCTGCGGIPESDTKCENCKRISRECRNKRRKRHKKLGICRCEGCHTPAKGTYCAKHRLEELDRQKASAKKFKIECLEAYGGAFCSCCRESELTTLCLDHINDDGHEQRKSLKDGINPHGQQFYRYLKSLGYLDKDKYQVLCANCNLYKHIKGGPCYHKVKDII